MAERILTGKMMKVPVDELPIKTVVIGDKHGSSIGAGRNPIYKLEHGFFGMGKRERFGTGKSTDRQRIGEPTIRDGS